MNNLKTKTNIYLENIERKEMVINENLDNDDFTNVIMSTKKIKKNSSYQKEHEKVVFSDEVVDGEELQEELENNS